MPQTAAMEWPLVGRDRVLESTGAILASESTGGVVVTGAAGGGKTRLALELSRAAQSRGCAVEWVRATRSAASVPLGAFAPLLRAQGAGAELLAGARQALVERAAGRRLVLCVDDGQLLDHASAALVHQLVAAGEVFAVVTLRRGDPAPDALRALWKDELCALVELAELSRGDVEALLGAALGGPLDGPSANGLWELTRGNVLFLRELVLYGAERGLLAEDGGIWRWRGEIAAGTRLAELVGARLEAVAGAPLEVVAVGAPLEVGVLDPGETAALDALERHAIVERRIDGRRRYVDVAHPLYGEVVRARLSRTRQEAIQRRLADALEARGRRRADVPRLAAWRLESGGGDGELFERAAWQALAALDATLAERFARAAGGGLGARLALGRALAATGRAEEADTVLSALEAQAVADTDRATVAIASARNLFWGLDRAADADAVLHRAERAVCDDRVRAEVEAQRVRLVAAHGRPQEALAAAEPLLRDPGVPEQARLQAAMAAAEALLASGRTAQAITRTETGPPGAQPPPAQPPPAQHPLLSQRALAR